MLCPGRVLSENACESVTESKIPQQAHAVVLTAKMRQGHWGIPGYTAGLGAVTARRGLFPKQTHKTG